MGFRGLGEWQKVSDVDFDLAGCDVADQGLQRRDCGLRPEPEERSQVECAQGRGEDQQLRHSAAVERWRRVWPAGSRAGSRAWRSWRSLLAIRWQAEHGLDPFLPGCEVHVLRSQYGLRVSLASSGRPRGLRAHAEMSGGLE